jgi:hypothetical protein
MDQKTKLIKIIENFIQTVPQVLLGGHYAPPEGKFASYGTIESSYFRHKRWRITSLQTQINGTNINLNPKIYTTIYPDWFKELKQESGQLDEYISLYFEDEPPIQIYKTIKEIQKTIPVKVRRKRFLLGFKEEEATLAYTENEPVYTIQCGAITETIDEQTYLAFKKQITDRRNAILLEIHNKEVNIAKQAIDKRFDEINHQYDNKPNPK